MAEAADALLHPYTYDVIRVDPTKREARKMMGGMAAEIVHQMADEMIHAAIVEWLTYEALRDQRKGSDSVAAVSSEVVYETITEPSNPTV